ncbi:MAG: hypothetical protein ACPGQP_01340, partial [Nitrosopumilus sp.]
DVLNVLLPKLKPGAIVVGDNIDLPDARKFLIRVTMPESEFTTTIVNKTTSISCYIGNGL